MDDDYNTVSDQNNKRDELYSMTDESENLNLYFFNGFSE